MKGDKRKKKNNTKNIIGIVWPSSMLKKVVVICVIAGAKKKNLKVHSAHLYLPRISWKYRKNRHTHNGYITKTIKKEEEE